MKRKTLILFGLASFITSLLFISPLRGQMTYEIYDLATKDSYVYDFDPEFNGGSQDWLIFGYYFFYYSDVYISFNTSNPPQDWMNAEIEINIFFISEETNLTVSLITANWDETLITWNNKPTYGQEITQITVLTVQVYSIDVSNFISGNSLSVCFHATSVPTGYVNATSREGHIESVAEGPKLTWTLPVPVPEEGIPGFHLLIIIGSILGICIYLIKRLKKS